VCLIVLAIDAHPRYPLVVAANRDEFFGRPAAPLDWWEGSVPPVLAGRDLSAGGSWLGLSSAGRVAILTNVRNPARQRAGASTRGALVPAWLQSSGSIESWWREQDFSAFNPFNMIGGDVASGTWWWADDRVHAPARLPAGIHGLSNASLNTPWPKVESARRALQALLATNDGTEGLASGLLDAFADRHRAEDAMLPDTGVGIARERALSSAFIHLPELAYGTRCTTVVIAERGVGATIVERSFGADGHAMFDRRAVLDDWPFAAVSPRRRVEHRDVLARTHSGSRLRDAHT
jgi:uncharacterized protein with NRDE domain